MDDFQPHGSKTVLETPHTTPSMLQEREREREWTKGLMSAELGLLLNIFLETASSDFCILSLGFS